MKYTIKLLRKITLTEEIEIDADSQGEAEKLAEVIANELNCAQYKSGPNRPAVDWDLEDDNVEIDDVEEA